MFDLCNRVRYRGVWYDVRTSDIPHRLNATTIVYYAATATVALGDVSVVYLFAGRQRGATRIREEQHDLDLDLHRPQATLPLTGTLLPTLCYTSPKRQPYLACLFIYIITVSSALGDQLLLLQVVDNDPDGLCDVDLVGLDVDLGARGSLVRCRDTGELCRRD